MGWTVQLNITNQTEYNIDVVSAVACWSNLSTLFTLFDFGDATTSTEIREQTNVAPQALYMMNSKFVTERSRALASKLLKSGTDDAGRVREAWETVLGRAPAAGEVQGSLAYMAGFPKLPGNDEGRLLAWANSQLPLLIRQLNVP